MRIPSFEEYLDSLSNLATVNDPTVLGAEGALSKSRRAPSRSCLT